VAKKCKIERAKRTSALKIQYADKRNALLLIIKNPETDIQERQDAYRKLARLPRDSSPTRHRNRCELTGRPRAYYRKFRISRIKLRELALEGKLPGVTKSSW
jgi:small subunit ribosomal protein S14